MKLGLRQMIGGAVAALLLGFAGLATAAPQTATPAKKPAPAGQAAPKAPAKAPARPAAAANKPIMADQVYKNIQVLKGLTEDQFIDTMAFISGGLGTNCIHCHSNLISRGDKSRWTAFAIDTPAKKTAREMIRMVQLDNKTFFDGQTVITCYTCHMGSDYPPEGIPSISAQYGPPTIPEQNAVPSQFAGSPTPDVLIDKFIAAVGGADKVATLKSFVEKGTYSGYDTDFQPVPLEVDAKTPDKYAWFVQTPFGTRMRVINGLMGWNATPDTSQVASVLPISGGRRFTYKVDAEIQFPAQLKSSMTRWVTGKVVMIAGEPGGTEDTPEHESYPVQGIQPGNNLPIKIYFNKATGLIDRVYTYSNTQIGIIASETDYSNWKDAGDGIKFPMHWVVSATDGQNVYDVTSVQINADIPDSKFNQPAPPKLLTPPPEAGGNEKNEAQ